MVNFYAVNLNAQRRFDKEDFFLKAYNAKDIRNIAIAAIRRATERRKEKKAA